MCLCSHHLAHFSNIFRQSFADDTKDGTITRIDSPFNVNSTHLSRHIFRICYVHRPYIRYTHIKLLFIPMQIISIKIITSKTFAGKCFAILMESKWCVENSVFIVCVEYWIRIVSIVFGMFVGSKAVIILYCTRNSEIAFAIE